MISHFWQFYSFCRRYTLLQLIQSAQLSQFAKPKSKFHALSRRLFSAQTTFTTSGTGSAVFDIRRGVTTTKMNEEISTSSRQEESPVSLSLPPTPPDRDPPHLPPTAAHLPSPAPLPAHLPPEREPPSWKSLLTGIFLSDHFSWIFEPSSAGMIFFSYYLLRFLI